MLQPQFISNSDSEALDSLRAKGVQFIDTTPDQISELCEVRHPELRDTSELTNKKEDFRKYFEDQTVYCFLPWRHVCVRLLSAELYEELRTARNRNLITKEEQAVFRAGRVAIAGLSVGSNIARLLTLQGGAAQMHLADADTLSLSNLNRILAGVADLGKKKTEILAAYLYEMNPFLRLTLISDGVTAANVDPFIYFDGQKADVIVDEIDDLAAKIVLRKKAAELKIPLVSVADNADGVIIRVERYDRDYTLAQFEERLAALPKQDPASLHIRDKAAAIVRFIGLDQVATEMLSCIPELGEVIYSWPQLGGAAVLAGVAGAYSIRRLLVNGDLASGTYSLNMPRACGIINAGDETRRKQLLEKFFPEFTTHYV